MSRITAFPRLSRTPLLLLSLGLLLAACGEEQAAPEVIRPAIVVQPDSAGMALTAFSGEMHARREPQLAFRIGGKLAKRHVDTGDRVKANQPLAELDADDVRLQLDVARAGLQAAEADLKLAASERERYQSLVERGLVGQSQFDARDNAWRLAQSKVQQARGQFDVAKNQSEYAILRAPTDGLIVSRLAEAGQVVAAGQPVFVMAEDGEREVAISLPEQDIDDFKLGQPMVVELWSKPGQRYPGKLRELSAAADPMSRTYAARVSLDDAKAAVELGQSARVYIGNTPAEGQLSLPLSAVTAEQGQAYVWVVDPQSHKVQRRDVRTGAYGESSVPIIDGLNAGEWVVAAGVHLLRAGQKIQPIDGDNRRLNIAAAP
ncbi:MAG TPA: efflux RND transporter periplasmic adaptor subunit [Xanthomonadaceae bacterium]|nr:efflux RND transporter periplasmic adaptor subunit [Xanthomonadaceae bacterium]HRY00662.1 efflux RND transporter periplasmic adaptor subunit [Xanthomonadaceae bacterium]